MSENRISLELSSHGANVGVARLTVATFAAQLPFTVAEIEEIKVVVSEAVSNAVIHGYSGEPGHLIRVEAWLADGELGIEVRDQGRGIHDLPAARQAAFSSDPERMGLGFVFMENFSDAIEVESQPGAGTRVVMRKRPQGQTNALASGRM